MTEYTPKNGWIVGKDKKNFSNRYIYEGNSDVYILAGDRPVIRLAERRVLLGTLRLFYGDMPLEDCEHIEMRYRPGMVEWTVTDPGIQGEIQLTVTSPGDGLGIVLKVKAPKALGFIYGGMTALAPHTGNPSKRWNLNVKYWDRPLLTETFREEWLESNEAQWMEGNQEVVISAPDTVRRIHIQADNHLTHDGKEAAGLINTYFTACFESRVDAAGVFEAGLKRADRLASLLTIKTPDEYINTAAAVAVGEMDGAWHGTKTMHGNTDWSQPLLGWLAHYGEFMTGSHDRAKELLKAYAAAQVKSEENTGYAMNATYTIPAQNSRYYGKGYVDEDQRPYNMQTQFFHQMIAAWRFSGDKEFGELLRDALRLHIEWQDECFDPEGTGLYASVINTWPTDSVSYSDGGAVEETTYAYAARKAMAELTEGEESEKYAQAAEKIKQAFFDELWINDKGYPATYKDRGGRAHEESWMYSSFMPVECNMLDQFQTAQALYYPLWAYERGENGGFWFSNWTPGIWSVRENAGGENMQQACAFLKGGQADEAMKIIAGAVRQHLNTEIPGEMMHPTIETASLFIKMVVDNLFGYHPDYPHGQVTIEPMLPYEWGKASIQTGDVSIEWERSKIRVQLNKPAALTIRMRLFADELHSVTGAESWSLEPGIGGMYVVIRLSECSNAEIQLHTSEERNFISWEDVDYVPVGEDIYNPQGIDDNSWGDHMVFRKLPGGYYQEIRVHLGEDPEKVVRRIKALTPVPEKASFETVDISDSFNADVTHIYKNQYLSPRPEKGCYAQVGLDGFTLWTFPAWGITPPEMTLEKTGEVKSGAGVPFVISHEADNIAFTSLWDNFPDEVEVTVGKKGKMAVVLVCGSTNPLQCGIENARLTFNYGEGMSEELPLINPENYISLCPYPRRATSTKCAINRSDVFNPMDISLMKDFTSEIVELGQNVRAMAVRMPIPGDLTLESVKLTACSKDIVVGIMAITVIGEEE